MKRGVTTLATLAPVLSADKRVAIRSDGSGTCLTARLLSNLSEVAPREMVLIDTDDALVELKAGRVDAMFHVAGYPVELFTEGESEADGLALIPIVDKSVAEVYGPAEIPAKTYGWQTRPVPTAAVKAALVSLDHRRRDCDLLAGSPGRSPTTRSGSKGTGTRSGSRSICSIR